MDISIVNIPDIVNIMDVVTVWKELDIFNVAANNVKVHLLILSSPSRMACLKVVFPPGF